MAMGADEDLFHPGGGDKKFCNLTAVLTLVFINRHDSVLSSHFGPAPGQDIWQQGFPL